MTTHAEKLKADRLVVLAAFHNGTQCLVCQKPLTAHIGELPCISSGPLNRTQIVDLPIAEWVWK